MKTIQEQVIITGFTVESQGLTLETNIPAKLKTGDVKRKIVYLSWGKIAQLLFEDYKELENGKISS